VSRKLRQKQRRKGKRKGKRKRKRKSYIVGRALRIFLYKRIPKFTKKKYRKFIYTGRIQAHLYIQKRIEHPSIVINKKKYKFLYKLGKLIKKGRKKFLKIKKLKKRRFRRLKKVSRKVSRMIYIQEEEEKVFTNVVYPPTKR
jgi:hypothetical protein